MVDVFFGCILRRNTRFGKHSLPTLEADVVAVGDLVLLQGGEEALPAPDHVPVPRRPGQVTACERHNTARCWESCAQTAAAAVVLSCRTWLHHPGQDRTKNRDGCDGVLRLSPSSLNISLSRLASSALSAASWWPPVTSVPRGNHPLIPLTSTLPTDV